MRCSAKNWSGSPWRTRFGLIRQGTGGGRVGGGVGGDEGLVVGGPAEVRALGPAARRWPADGIDPVDEVGPVLFQVCRAGEDAGHPHYRDVSLVHHVAPLLTVSAMEQVIICSDRNVTTTSALDPAPRRSSARKASVPDSTGISPMPRAEYNCRSPSETMP